MNTVLSPEVEDPTPCLPRAEERLPVLLVGNFLSAAPGLRGVCEDLAGRLVASGWPVLTTSARRARLPRVLDMVTTIWHQRRSYAVAQVDVYSGPAFLWAEAASRMLRRVRRPYILTLHGGNLPEFARRWPQRVRRLLQPASSVTAPSRYLVERMRPYRESIHLLPNPLDAAAYPFRARAQARPALIWLRAFHAVYNPALAPRVVAELASDYPDIRLVMIGPDKGDGSLQQTQRVAADLGVSDRIGFPGGVPKADVPMSMSLGDIFLNTTNCDNTPVSVLEAMACGLCVVSTNVGGIPYLLEHGRDALLVPPDDAQAMAAAVRQILTDPELSQSLSMHAHRKAEECDWKVVLPQWERLLVDAAQRGQHARPS